MPQLDSILKNSPVLQGSSTVNVITAGYSHQCFQVSTTNGQVFLKIFNVGQEQQQLDISQLASKVGLAPQVLEICPKLGYLITEFIDAPTLMSVDLGVAEKLQISAELIYQCHQMKARVTRLELSDTLNELLLSAKLPPSSIGKLAAYSASLIQTITIDDKRLVLSHGDVNFNNILVAVNKNYLLDWEYCYLAEPEFDLAMCLAINQIDMSLQPGFIKHYQQYLRGDGRFSHVICPEKVTRYHEYSLFINALWFVSLDVNNVSEQQKVMQLRSKDYLSNIISA
ncbi:hypothetical protein ND16A_0688 [Thalassotalea sp. ND16A]|nr:hypothetical protein ND16A_0688 [Thalassotalea sp. ND16A]